MQSPLASLDDAAELGYTVTDANLKKASIRIRTLILSLGYPVPESPDEALIDLTCAVAQRLGAIPAGLAGGVQTQQQAAGSFSQSVGFGWDAWKAKADLDQGEKDALRRMFPPVPRTISMGSPVDLHLEDGA